MNKAFDVTVIGGGPAGLAAAIAADARGASVLLIEREKALGGILKQCIHDGFGLVRYGERLTGPEYAGRFTDAFYARRIEAMTSTFVTRIERRDAGFAITATTREGMRHLETRAIVFATGCRERTAKQASIHGTRPAGVFTAGTAQHYVNRMGYLPTKRCVILGSGDIGLIMARRLTLEGAEVVGVYEVMDSPSGLTRNIAQCLHDFDIPLHLSHTVTRVFGESRVTAVEVAKVDENRRPIPGTQTRVACDALILSVGLIPENELIASVGVPLDARTGGALCDNRFMTDVFGVYACGNCLHVNDLVDYVSESGALAGAAAAEPVRADRTVVDVVTQGDIRYVVPQRVDITSDLSQVILYFRSARVLKDAVVTVTVGSAEVYRKKYAFLKPPEMERLSLDLSGRTMTADTRIVLSAEAEA